MPQILGAKGDAVAVYREPLATTEMRYTRLSLGVKNLVVFYFNVNTTWWVFPPKNNNVWNG